MNRRMKKGRMLVLAAILSVTIGCGNQRRASSMEKSDPVIEQLSKACHDIFESAFETNTTDSLEVAKSLVERIGENGYTAVDRKNQVNMVNAEQAVRFCGQAEAGKRSELTIIAVEYTGGMTKYDVHAEAGNLEIVKSYYQYEDGGLKNKSTYSYPADFWQYTEDGYFLFRGSYHSQDYYIYALSDVSVCTALRVQPLDEKCRAWNRRYILPIGYSRNDLFLLDWNEQDFGELNFYDIFDKCYPLVNDVPVPYRADANLGVSAVYPRKNVSRAFAHEIVIRPLKEGTFQYVSNRIIPSPDNDKPTWHRARLTEERWNEFYGKN